MLNSEHDFINHIIVILKREGYQIENETRVPEGYRVDLKAFKENETFGIEVKFEKRGISDDISKCYKLHQLPEFDRVYVAAPKILISDDHIAFARNLKVGILGVDHDSIIKVSESDKLKSAELQSGASLPKQMITPGKSFVVSKTVRNLGGKPVRRIDESKNRPDYFFSEKYKNTWKIYLRKLILHRIYAQFPTLEKTIVIKEPNGSFASDIISECLPNSKIIIDFRDARDVLLAQTTALSKGGYAAKEDQRWEPLAGRRKLNFIKTMAYRWLVLADILLKAYNSHSEE